MATLDCWLLTPFLQTSAKLRAGFIGGSVETDVLAGSLWVDEKRELGRPLLEAFNWEDPEPGTEGVYQVRLWRANGTTAVTFTTSEFQAVGRDRPTLEILGARIREALG